MKRFDSLEELQQASLHSGWLGAMLYAFPDKSDPPVPTPPAEDAGSAYLLQSADSDATVAQVFGVPLMELTFERVRFLPDDERFLCELVREDSHRDILVIPDANWLDDGWRAWLVSLL